MKEGELTDLGALDRVRGVEAYPYLLARVTEAEHDSAGTRIGDGVLSGTGSIEVKVPLKPSRVPFFFPEKREFFLESSGLFDFGTPGRVQLFYSRRVGLDTAGAAVPIIAGARLPGPPRPGRIGLLATGN